MGGGSRLIQRCAATVDALHVCAGEFFHAIGLVMVKKRADSRAGLIDGEIFHGFGIWSLRKFHFESHAAY